MKIKRVAQIVGGQDGAIYGGALFRLNTTGECTVYRMAEVLHENMGEPTPLAKFRLDRADVIVPHSNAVCFGCEFYEDGDEYPLLYTNIYNNYYQNEDKMLGVCLVYRIRRVGNQFSSELVQLIEVGFCEDHRLWKVAHDRHGVRPYGNFVIDRESGAYWAFVMRDESLGTRFFRFDLPKVRDGAVDARLGVNRVVLRETNVRQSFDREYYRYIQGASLHKGKIYATEGFSNDSINRPAIRVIDLATGREEYFDVMKNGFPEEPEWIDFYEDACFYSDIHGNFYTVEF